MDSRKLSRDISREYSLLLPPRKHRSNKGSYGKVLICAGSFGMAGAAWFAVEAAYRCGAGLVMCVSDPANRAILQTKVPEALYKSPDDLKDVMAWPTVIGAGPGMGTGPDAAKNLMHVLSRRDIPAVLDADALNILSRQPGSLHGENIIITPHPGEMARLTGLKVSEILADTAGCAAAFAKKHHLICVLKDEHTVVTDGDRVFLNPSGCDGMASGGSGDVLTGMICGLLAQGMKTLEAARLAAYLHGRAGEAAQDALGSRSMLARDILAHIPDAFMELER